VEEKAFWTAVYQQFLPPEEKEHADEPWSDIMVSISSKNSFSITIGTCKLIFRQYPVIVGMDTNDTFGNEYDLKKYPVVSTLDTMVYWREFIKDLLPGSSQGIIIVFDNPCAVPFTYQIS
jgi:hypothetical protein